MAETIAASIQWPRRALCRVYWEETSIIY